MIIYLLKTLFLIIFLNQHSCAEVEAYVLQPVIIDPIAYSNHTNDVKNSFPVWRSAQKKQCGVKSASLWFVSSGKALNRTPPVIKFKILTTASLAKSGKAVVCRYQIMTCLGWHNLIFNRFAKLMIYHEPARKYRLNSTTR